MVCRLLLVVLWVGCARHTVSSPMRLARTARHDRWPTARAHLSVITPLYQLPRLKAALPSKHYPNSRLPDTCAGIYDRRHGRRTGPSRWRIGAHSRDNGAVLPATTTVTRPGDSHSMRKRASRRHDTEMALEDEYSPLLIPELSILPPATMGKMRQ
jgi:hypothetical protein